MDRPLIIWDCDGVLVDSEWIGARAFSEIIQELGGHCTTEEVYHALKGGSIFDSIKYVEQKTATSVDLDIEQLYRKRSHQLFQQELKQVDGVEEVLKSTSTYRCIASNGPKIKIFQNLHITRLKEYFDDHAIFSGHDIDRFKPLPDLFLLAAKKMGSHPNHCIVIEDSIFGAMAAQAAGMQCYGYCAETDASDFIRYGAKPFNHMRELLEVLH